MACPALTKEVAQTQGCCECEKGGWLAYHPGPGDFLLEMDAGRNLEAESQGKGRELQPGHGHSGKVARA